MLASVATNVATYRRKQHKAKEWIISLIIEAWDILLLSTIQVELNSFNGSYAGMIFMYSYCIIDEGNLGKNFPIQILFYKITLLY
jgi:hypothetical protein